MRINPTILVEMIQCDANSRGVHSVAPQTVSYGIGEPFAYGICGYCLNPIFSDLRASEQFKNPNNPMSKFCDSQGNLWVGNQPTYIIREEEDLW